MMTHLRRLALFLGLMPTLGACGASTSGAGTQSPTGPRNFDEITVLERWMPLKDGSIYSYETRHSVAGAAPEVGVLTLSVRRDDATHVRLEGGTTTRHLTLTPQAIADAGGGSLLELPLELGHSWTGLSGPVKVTAVGVSVDVPAGHFDGCLQTEELASDGTHERSVLTTWCPGVGMAQFLMRLTGDSGEDRLQAELRYHGPKLDLGPSGTRVLNAP